ncbi:MAG: NAD(+) diphosphatase [Pseudomonadota bacterium]
MLHGNPNAFTANPLNRAGVERKDPAWLDAQRKHPGAKLLILYRGEVLIDRQPTLSRIQWLTLDAVDALPVSARETVLLGLWDGQPIYACDPSDADQPPFADLGEYGSLRNLAPFLSPEELGIAGQASWLLDWHRRQRFCAAHGDATVSAEGGFKRVNPKTGTEHFPRCDPVAIVLPYKDDAVCLGRGPQFPQGFMSAFAGYLEAGETLEMCGARELFEEAGLKIISMKYIFSQPWPFPSSLMMGFIAEVEDTSLTLDPTEIEEARWFSRQDLTSMMKGEGAIMVPPKFTIAHQLMKVWLERPNTRS